MRDSVLISPSILSADLANLGRDLKMIDNADLIHIDVMDGHFTQNLTFGAGVVAAAKRSNVPLDVHMMVTNPDETVDEISMPARITSLFITRPPCICTVRSSISKSAVARPALS